MRLSHFWMLMDGEFGRSAATIAKGHALRALGDRTADEALEQGYSARAVWEAVCDELEVPPERRNGAADTGAPGGFGAVPEPPAR